MESAYVEVKMDNSKSR